VEREREKGTREREPEGERGVGTIRGRERIGDEEGNARGAASKEHKWCTILGFRLWPSSSCPTLPSRHLHRHCGGASRFPRPTEGRAPRIAPAPLCAAITGLRLLHLFLISTSLSLGFLHIRVLSVPGDLSLQVRASAFVRRGTAGAGKRVLRLRAWWRSDLVVWWLL
jgi:hypothetical protein